MTCTTRASILLAPLAVAAAASAQCPESGGILTGSACGMSTTGIAAFDPGEYYLKKVGFLAVPPGLWSTPSGPSFRIGDAMRQWGVTGDLPDVDAMSTGQDWILADNRTGRIDIDPDRWGYLRFSVSRTSRGAPGSRIAAEAAAPLGAGADMFTWVLPGSALPSEHVDVVERAQDSSEIDLGGARLAPPEIDALDDLSPFYDRRGGWSQVMPPNPQFFFSVSNATIPRVPGAWWSNTPRSGGSVFVMTWLGTAGWTQPRVWRRFDQLNLDQSEDLDALSVDLERQRILFSTKTRSRNQILFQYFGALLAAADPVPYADQGGTPVSDKVGLIENDDVDAICAGDPSVRGTGGTPRNPLFLGVGTPFPGLFQNPTRVTSSSYRHAIGAREYIDTHMVGWPPNTGPGPGLAVLFLTPRPLQPPAPAVLVDIQARNPGNPFCGDPRSVRIEIPAALSLSYAQLGLRWFALDAAGTEFAEAAPLRIVL